ncbi:MAG TPA: DUF2079 domain-containing protein [Pseudolabrys sp.]|jgi:hypothetical protein
MMRAQTSPARLMPDARTDTRATLFFALGLIALYIGVMAAKFALWRANVLMSDWAFYNNSFWNTDFQHYWLFSHDRIVLFGYPSYLNEHFGPLLLVIAALYHWVPYPEAMLLLLHGAAPVLAAIFIYATAVHLIGDRPLAATIAMTYALTPGILWPTISLVYGFEPDGMLAPLAAAVAWALATRRTGVYFTALVLALAIKENVPAYGLILGACLFLFTDRRRQALATMAISFVVFLIASKGVPAITGVENRNVGRVWTFIDNVVHLRPTFDYTLAQIVIGLGYSVVFLPALYVWPYLAMLGPDLLLIGQVSYANTVTWHVMLPVTMLGSAAVFGTTRILKTDAWPATLDRRMPRLKQVRLYWTAMLIVSLIAGPATIWLGYSRYIALRSPVDPAAAAQAMALVPADAGVIVTSDLEQYFVRHRVISSRPDVVAQAGGDFSYFAVNRFSLNPGRVNGPLAAVAHQDACFIAAAERLAGQGGAKVMDAGGILVVRFDKLPKLNCG